MISALMPYAIGAVVAVLAAFGLYHKGRKDQRTSQEIEARNRTIATQQRISDAKDDMPLGADDARKRLHDRARR